MPMAREATLERRANKINHAVVVRRGGNEAGHGQIARYPPVVKSILGWVQH